MRDCWVWEMTGILRNQSAATRKKNDPARKDLCTEIHSPSFTSPSRARAIDAIIPTQMTTLFLESMTWTEVQELPPSQYTALLPIGATEAHGPHLPLATDVVIAQGMAKFAADALLKEDISCIILPPLSYTAAPFARAFPGTLSLRPDTLASVLNDVLTQVLQQDFARVVLCNAHLDPTHIRVLRETTNALNLQFGGRVVFPDITRRSYAKWLTPEFQSGACHAGQYEGSIVLAERPAWVRHERMAKLPANPVSLSDAMRAGHDDFISAGGEQAYFGDPAAASAQEGLTTLRRLADIVVHALTGKSPPSEP